jgi:hypothetical protein
MEGVCAQGDVVRCMSLGMAAFHQGGRATTPLQLNPALAVPREPREQPVLGRQLVRDGVPLTEGSGDNQRPLLVDRWGSKLTYTALDGR